MIQSLVDPHDSSLPDVIDEDQWNIANVATFAVNKWASAIALGRKDGSLVLCDFDTKSQVRVETGVHTAEIIALDWSRSGRYLLSCGKDRVLCCRDVSDGRVLYRHTTSFEPLGCKLHPKDKLIAVVWGVDHEPEMLQFAQEGEYFSLFSSVSLKPESEVDSLKDGNTKKIQETFISAAFSKDGSYIIVGGSKGGLVVWKTEASEVVSRVNLAASISIKGISFSRDGLYVVITSSDRYVRVLDFNDGKISLTPKREYQDNVNRMSWKFACLSGSSDYLAAASIKKDHHHIYIWNSFGQFVTFLEGPREGIEMIYWHPYLPQITVLTNQGFLKVWSKNKLENWSALAPNFKVIEENVIYEEKEDEFDLKPDNSNSNGSSSLEPIDLVLKMDLGIFSADEDDTETLPFLKCIPIPDKDMELPSVEQKPAVAVKRKNNSKEIQEDLSTSKRRRKSGSK